MFDNIADLVQHLLDHGSLYLSLLRELVPQIRRACAWAAKRYSAWKVKRRDRQDDDWSI